MSTKKTRTETANRKYQESAGKARRRIESPDGETFTWEIVTPQKAKEYLATMTAQRHLNMAMVKAFEWDMAAGKFFDGVGEIVFDTKGRLIDGQTRLTAAINTNTTLEMWVKRNVNPETRPVIDGGRAWSASDVLRGEGYKHCATIAAISKMIALKERGFSVVNAGIKITPQTIRDVVKRYPDITEVAAHFGNKKKGLRTSGLNESIAAFLYWSVMPKYKEDAEEFLEKVIEGIELSRTEPAYVLRNALINMHKSLHKADRPVVLAWTIKAWNAFILGKTIKQVRFISGELFPVMTGDRLK